MVRVKVGCIHPDKPPGDITIISTSYDKGNIIVCIPTNNTAFGRTETHGTEVNNFTTIAGEHALKLTQFNMSLL